MNLSNRALLFIQAALFAASFNLQATEVPDFQVSYTEVENSVHISEEEFAPSSCAIVERCLGGPGLRRLLRFSAAIINSGQGDFYLGNPAENSLFEYSSCHRHYHLNSMMLYE